MIAINDNICDILVSCPALLSCFLKMDLPTRTPGLLLPFLSFPLPLCAKLAAVVAKLWHFLQVLYFDPGGRIVLHLDCEHCFSESVEVLSSSLDIIMNRVQSTWPNSCCKLLHYM